MRIVVASAPFKGTMTASQATERIAAGLAGEFPGAMIERYPMADGGDGTLEALLAHGFAPMAVPAADALGRPRQAVIGWRGSDAAAAIELASICGIAELGERRLPRDSTSIGLGLAMRAAIDAGAASLVVALGGSASTDGGLGLLRGLDSHSAREGAVGGLAELESVVAGEAGAPAIRPLPIPVRALVDVASPLIGPEGAAMAFGPQKGLDAAACARADAALASWAALLRIDPAEPGTGAAGGCGAALLALGARLELGGPAIASLLGLAEAIAGADLVVTGEGRLDRTSLAGKAPAVVAGLASEAGVPCRIVAGAVDHSVARALRATAVRWE